MVTLRGFLQRTLPALLALVLAGFAAAPAPAVAVTAFNGQPAISYAAQPAPAGHSAPASERDPAAEASPVPAVAAPAVADTPQVLRPQPVAGVRGSRAPPAGLV